MGRGRETTGAVGRRAEQKALRYLVAHGLRPVHRNFRTRGGEIDLVMNDHGCLVFVEVRFRQSADFAPVSHTVDSHKQRRIIRTAAVFLARNRRFADACVRFDIVTLEGRQGEQVDWIRDAFRPEDSSL